MNSTITYRKNTQSSQHISSSRQYGYDFARALAVIGMVVVNFKVVMGAETNGPDWLIWLVGLLDGRAAATFVVLAGVGMSLACRRALMEDDNQLLKRRITALRKRAAFLFIFGLAYTPLWPADILHFYGFYILLGTFLIKSSDGELFLSISTLVIIFLLLLLIFDYEQGWNWKTLEYTDLWTMEGMLRHIFFNGFHPVFPWAAFLVGGMWLGRKDLGVKTVRIRLFLVGLAMTVFGESVSHFLTEYMLVAYPFVDPVDIQDTFGTAPLPPMPLYMISAGGTALMIITLSTWFTSKVSSANIVMKSLIVTGQYALTFYIAHVVIGMGVLEEIGRLENQDLQTSVTSALLFCFVGIVLSMVWNKFFRRGPLEWVLRKVSG